MILPQFFLKLKEKIAHGVLKTRDCLIATYDKGNVSDNTLHSIYPLEQNLAVDLYYLLGIINSSLLNWYYRIVNYLEVGKTMAEVKGIYIKKLPMGEIRDKKILDFGSGIGVTANYLAEHNEVTGIGYGWL